MESVTSMMSVSANDGVRNLDDDELDIGDHSAETSAQIYELANKFSELMQNENSSADQMGHKPAYQLTGQWTFLTFSFLQLIGIHCFLRELDPFLTCLHGNACQSDT